MDSFTSSGRRARHRDRLTNACFLYVIKIGSSRSLYIGIETHIPLPEAHQTTLLGAREGPDKRPSEASSAGPFEAKEASSKCMMHGDGRAVIVVHEHDSHGSAVAKCQQASRESVKDSKVSAPLNVAARLPQPSQPSRLPIQRPHAHRTRTSSARPTGCGRRSSLARCVPVLSVFKSLANTFPSHTNPAQRRGLSLALVRCFCIAGGQIVRSMRRDAECDARTWCRRGWWQGLALNGC